jgi:exodeoxyribonuclease-3
VRFLTVNLRSGGSRASIEALIGRCLQHRPDILVFAEFRHNTTGNALRRRLATEGFVHQAGSTEHTGNGVLVASTLPFEPLLNSFGLRDDEYPNAIVEARFGELRAYAVYLPGQDRKRPHLRCLIAAAHRSNELAQYAIALGDFNSGRNATDIEINVGKSRFADEFSTADLNAELETHWTEAWSYMHPNEREFSWYPFRNNPPAQRRNGWRIDKAFVSQALLPYLRAAQYDHGFRLEGLTDHSALIVDVDYRAAKHLASLAGSEPGLEAIPRRCSHAFCTAGS